MSYAWYTLDGNQAAGLWTLVWRVETGCRSSNIDVTDFCVLLGDICEKIQVLRHENVLLKHYTFPRTLKKLRGNIVTICLYIENLTCEHGRRVLYMFVCFHTFTRPHIITITNMANSWKWLIFTTWSVGSGSYTFGRPWSTAPLRTFCFCAWAAERTLRCRGHTKYATV